MKTITSRLLDELANAAVASPRRRTNHNLHPELSDPIQRLVNSMAPGTYVRPHRHADPPRWESFVALRGRAVILTFDDDGRIVWRAEVSPQGPQLAVELPAGVWHTIAVLEPATALFEVKPGPYDRLTDKDFAPWAPPEGDPASARMVEWFCAAQIGETPPDRSGS
jgi:cupin fold WbuC family metalloprotein